MTGKPDDLSAEKSQRYLLIGLTIALVAWGGFLAVGSYLGGANLQDNVRRGLVVFGCIGGFLAFWWALLLTSKRRAPRNRASDPKPEPTKRSE